jgi:Adenine specific DNA methylase Mod
MAKAKKVKDNSNPKPIEQYEHKDKQRLNNPPVGLVDVHTDNGGFKKKTYQYDPHLDPQLQWAGKAEHTSFDVPTVSLHVHERIDPRRIIDTVKKADTNPQMSLFEEQKKPLREAIEFYKHKENWTNRLIAGDSLLVMNSLLEKEGMAGKVQMVYFDPPYGISYRSNFQPFINKRDVKDTDRDEDLNVEPEMLKAFRDTWELGIHSYLSYIRDRVKLAYDLLSENGSIFVQIGTENVHLIRNILDEIFGLQNFYSQISFRKKMMPLSKKPGCESMNDYLLWYVKDKEKAYLKIKQLFVEQKTVENSSMDSVELRPFERRPLTEDEKLNPSSLPPNAKLYQTMPLKPREYRPNQDFNIDFEGKDYPPMGGNVNQTPDGIHCWSTTKEGLTRIKYANRLEVSGNYLRYVLFHDDYPVTRLTANWNDTAPATNMKYVVETSPKVLMRCILMATDPGDVVLDITCGSGVTALESERLGRRWITCDTSRVALTIAKQNLITKKYDYYKLAYPNEGVASGFLYETVPHITSGSIANNKTIDNIYVKYKQRIDSLLEDMNHLLQKNKMVKLNEWEIPINTLPEWSNEIKSKHHEFWQLKIKMLTEINSSIERNADQETLYDKPIVDSTRIRVTGPFTVEAVPAPVAKSFDDVQNEYALEADNSIARSGETVRQDEWRQELLKAGVRAKGGRLIEFTRVEPLSGTRFLQAEAETKEDNPKRVVVCFGPEHAPLEQRMVELALEEARTLRPKPEIVLFCAFHFDPEARKDIEETNWPGITLLEAQMNADLLTDDLKKRRSSNESFWLIGQPDVQIKEVKSGDDNGKYAVEVHGFDYYNPKTGTVDSGGKGDIAMWMLDHDYDGRSLFPSQVFFPMAGAKEGWATLAKNLKAEIDEEKIEAYSGTVSLPFTPGKNVAVKIIDARGIESLKIIRL